MLTQITDSPDFYNYLYLAILLLIAFNIAEVVVLLVHKARVERGQARKEKAKRRIADAVICQDDPCEGLRMPSDDVDHAAFGEALSSILESVEGEMADRAVKVIRRFGIDAYYRRMAAGRFWFKRASAVDVLSGFRLAENRQFFLEAFAQESEPAVKYRMLYALSFLVRDRADTMVIAARLASLPYLTSKYTEDIFFNIIATLKQIGKEDDFGEFMLGMMKDHDVPPLVKRDCLSACNAASCERSRPIVLAYYKEFPGEPEILIACIKSLAKLGDATLFGEALAHQDWRVRLAVLKHAEICGGGVIPAIRRLLRDPNYHIRVNAALALAKFGSTGTVILRVESRGKDRFAAEAAAYALSLAGGAL